MASVVDVAGSVRPFGRNEAIRFLASHATWRARDVHGQLPQIG